MSRYFAVANLALASLLGWIAVSGAPAPRWFCAGLALSWAASNTVSGVGLALGLGFRLQALRVSGCVGLVASLSVAAMLASAFIWPQVLSWSAELSVKAALALPYFVLYATAQLLWSSAQLPGTEASARVASANRERESLGSLAASTNAALPSG